VKVGVKSYDFGNSKKFKKRYNAYCLKVGFKKPDEIDYSIFTDDNMNVSMSAFNTIKDR